MTTTRRRAIARAREELRGAREIGHAENGLVLVAADVGQHLAVLQVEEFDRAAAEDARLLAQPDHPREAVDRARGAHRRHDGALRADGGRHAPDALVDLLDTQAETRLLGDLLVPLVGAVVASSVSFAVYFAIAGAVFLGRWSSEAIGDYCAGPNHVLPTVRTARFSSPLGVYDFQKRSSLIEVSEAGARVLGPIAAGQVPTWTVGTTTSRAPLRTSSANVER